MQGNQTGTTSDQRTADLANVYEEKSEKVDEQEEIDQEMILYEGRQISTNEHQVHSSHVGQRPRVVTHQQQGRSQTSHVGVRHARLLQGKAAALSGKTPGDSFYSPSNQGGGAQNHFLF